MDSLNCVPRGDIGPETDMLFDPRIDARLSVVENGVADSTNANLKTNKALERQGMAPIKTFPQTSLEAEEHVIARMSAKDMVQRVLGSLVASYEFSALDRRLTPELEGRFMRSLKSSE